MTDIPPQLDYAPPVPGRKKWVWRGGLILLLAAVATASIRWGPAEWQQVQILYWQHACMTYSPSTDTVVYEENPTAAAELLAKKAGYWHYVLRRENGRDSKAAVVNAAAFCSDCYSQFQIASGIPGAGTNMFTMNTVGSPATAFLHERRSPAGHRRLVVIAYHPEPGTFTGNFIENYNYDEQAISLATLLHPPSVPPRSFALDVLTQVTALVP
jgi:hypothetical protein